MIYHLKTAYKFWQFQKSIERMIKTIEGTIQIAKQKQSRIQEMRIKLNELNLKFHSI